MPNKFYCLLVGLLLLASASIAPAREWQDKTGKFRIEANFVSCKDDKVYLEKPDGSVIGVPIETLCYTDYDFLRTLPEMQEYFRNNLFPTEHTVYYVPKLGAVPTGLTFSPDGRWLVMVVDGQIQMLDLQKEAPAEVKRSDSPLDNDLESIHFSPDGQRLISLSRVSTAVSWVWKGDGSLGQRDKVRLEIPTRFVKSVTLNKDGTKLLCAISEGSLYYVDIERGNTIHSFEGNFSGQINDCFINPKGTQALATNGQSLILYDLVQGKPIQMMKLSPVHWDHAGISVDGRHVMTVDSKGDSQYWDVVSGEVSSSMRPNKNFSVYKVIFSPNGKYVLMGKSKSIGVWSLQKESHVVNLNTSGDSTAKTVAVSRDDQFVAVASSVSYNRVALQVFKIPEPAN